MLLLMRSTFALFAVAASVFVNSLEARQELYLRAAVDSTQRLIITRSDGQQVVLAKLAEDELDGQQTEFRAVAVSPDGRTVGWIAYFTGCCSSSPYPRKFEVYSNGERRTIATRVAVSAWGFVKDGAQLAYVREQLHGDAHPVYELIETATGRRLEEFSPEDGSRQPDWVAAVRRQR